MWYEFILYTISLINTAELIRQHGSVNYALAINYSKITEDIQVTFKIIGIFNVCYHEETLVSGSMHHNSKWDSPYDCGSISNITITDDSSTSLDIASCVLTDGRDVYGNTEIERNRSIAMHRMCIKGWKPDYCDFVRYHVTVKVKKRRVDNIKICGEDSFMITFVGSLGSFTLSFGKLDANKDLVTKTIEEPDIGTLEEVSFDPQMCGDFHLGVIILESDVNIFRTYGGFRSKGSKQSSTNIRITCKEGSRVFVCNHVQYSIEFDGDIETSESSRILIVGHRGSIDTNLLASVVGGNVIVENPNIADVLNITLLNTKIVNTSNIVIQDTRRRYIFTCDKNSKCELTTTVCKLGWSPGDCDTVELRITVVLSGLKNLSVKLIVSDTKIKPTIIHLNGDDEDGKGSVGGLYLFDMDKFSSGISRMKIKNNIAVAKTGIRITEIAIHYGMYKVIPRGRSYRLVSIYTLREVDIYFVNVICLWRWDPKALCNAQQTVFVTDTPDHLVIDYLLVPSRSKKLFQKQKEERVIIRDVYEDIRGSRINGFTLLVATYNMSTGTFFMKIYTAVQMYEISGNASSLPFGTYESLTPLTMTCYPGLTGDDCLSVCENNTYGQSCRPCQCENSTRCDPLSGWCNSGRCPPRLASPYCDWTCEPGHYGFECEHVSVNVTNCKDSRAICDSGCVKAISGDICSERCLGVYGSAMACPKKCHCLNDGQCDSNTGKCPDKCQIGYYSQKGSNDCQRMCSPGTFGENCSKTCMCPNNDICDFQSGKCPNKCKIGYVKGKGEGDCQLICSPGTFGENCNKTCKCRNNETCDFKSGKCPNKCDIGHFNRKGEYDCQLMCSAGSFGENCSKTCMCRKNETCDFQSGKCPNKCQIGYYNGEGETGCQRMCLPGTFGEDCSKTCMCRKNETCDIQSGQCPSGCADGRTGSDCQTETKKTDQVSLSIEDIAVYVGSGILVLAISIISVCVMVRRKNSKQKILNRASLMKDGPTTFAASLRELPLVNEPAYTGGESTHTMTSRRRRRSSARTGDVENTIRSRDKRRPSRSKNRDSDDYDKGSTRRGDDSEADTRSRRSRNMSRMDSDVSVDRRRRKDRSKKLRDDESSFTDVTERKRGRKSTSRFMNRQDSSLSSFMDYSEKSRDYTEKSRKSRNRNEDTDRSERSESQGKSRKSRKKKKPPNDEKNKSLHGSKSGVNRTKSKVDDLSKKSPSAYTGIGLQRTVSFGHVMERPIAPRPNKDA